MCIGGCLYVVREVKLEWMDRRLSRHAAEQGNLSEEVAASQFADEALLLLTRTKSAL